MASSLIEVVEQVRAPNGEAAFTGLRKLREAFQDERAPGKCVGTVRQFFVLSSKDGNPILEAWERHGAERASSRVVVYALAAAAALFTAARRHAAADITTQTGLPTKASKAFDEMKRSNLSDVRSMAKTILVSRPGAILAVLSARGAERAILGMLALLKEIAQLGGFLAREIMTQIDWGSRQLSTLILPQNFKIKQMKMAEKEKEGKKGSSESHESAVRAALIRLHLALLESGSAEPDVIFKALTGKQFLPAIWKDFGNDPPSLTQPVLKVLTEHVLIPSVTAKTKRLFLNTYALTQIGKLYFSDARWDAHKFLMAVFSDPEHGFCATIVDGAAKGGIGGAGNTSGVLQFLVSLRANEHTQPRELLLKVLRVCPQMQASYIPSFPFMLEPNETLRWLSNVDLFCAVLQLPWCTEQRDSDVLRQRVDATMWPVKLGHAVLSKGLQHSNHMVRFHVVLMLAGILERVQRIMGVGDFAEELKPKLPEVQLLFAMVAPPKVAKGKAAAPKRHDLLLRSLVMRVIHMYTLLVPTALGDVKVDIDKLTSGQSLVALPEQLRKPLLSFMVGAHTHIEWWKREQSKGSKSKFGEVLQFLSVPDLREQASELASTLLHSTGLFEGCEWEIGCWLYPLCRPDAEISAAADFLDAVLQQARQKQVPLTDVVSGAIAGSSGTISGRFSVVIPAVLQRLNSGNDPSAEKWGAKPQEDREYAVAVMATILRCHVAPMPLCALLMQQGADGNEDSAEERTELIALANRTCTRLSEDRAEGLGSLVSESAWAVSADGDEGTLWRGARTTDTGDYDEVKLASICESYADDDFTDVLDDVSREPSAGAHRCVASLLSTLAERTPSSYKPLACNQVIFQINMLLHEEGTSWSSEAVCKFLQTLFYLAQQLVGSQGFSGVTSATQLEACVERTLALGEQLSAKEATRTAARMMLFEAVSLWLSGRSEKGSFDLTSSLVDSVRDECDGDDESDHRPCTLLVQMFRTQWDGATLARCIGTIFSNYKGEVDATHTWVLSSLLRFWAESDEAFELPSSCFEGLVWLLTANVSDEVDAMATTVIRRTLCSTGQKAASSAVVGGLLSFLTPEFMTLCWDTADVSRDRRAILTMLIQRSPLHRRLFMGKVIENSQAASDLRGKLWDITPDRDALLDAVGGAQGIGQGSPLLLGLLESIAAAVTEADDSELAEYHPVLRDVYVPMLSSIVLGADRGSISGDAVALPGSASGQITPESVIQEVRSYLENASSPWWGYFGNSAIAILQRVVTHRATSAADLGLMGQLALERLQQRMVDSATAEGAITIDQLRLLDLLFLRVKHVDVVLDDQKATLVFACISLMVNGIPLKEEESLVYSVLDDCLSAGDETANILAAVARSLDPGFKQCGKFARKQLKTRYRSQESMRCVALLSEHVLALDANGQCEDIVATGFPSASELCERITEHSAFSKLCASESGALASRTEILSMLSVAAELAQEDADDETPVLPVALMPVFYSGFTATESEADRALMTIFTTYERSGTSPLVAWEKSAEHPLLAGTGIPEPAAFAAMMDAAEYVDMVTTTLAAASTSIVQDTTGEKAYATDFLLPYCDAVVQSDVSSRKCIDLGVAGFIMACLTSSKLERRQLAYHTMARFLDKVTADSAFAERFQVMLLLHCVRGGIEQAYQRLPAVITTFCSASFHVLVRPDHALYSQINRFLLQRAALDLTDIPMFYTLFNSGDAKDFKVERGWILKVLLDSVAPTGLDLPVFRRRHVFELLMGFFDVGFSDAYTCRLVIQILERCCAIPSFLVALVETHGLVAWLSRLILADRIGSASKEGKPDSKRKDQERKKDAETQPEEVQDYGEEILGSIIRLLSNILDQYRTLDRLAAFGTTVLPQFASVITNCVAMLRSEKVPWSAASMSDHVVEPALELMLELLQQSERADLRALAAGDLLPLLSRLDETPVESRCRTLLFAMVCHWPVQIVASARPEQQDMALEDTSEMADLALAEADLAVADADLDALIQYACNSGRCAELAAAQESDTAWPIVYSSSRQDTKQILREAIDGEQRSAEWLASMLVVRWLCASAMDSTPSFAGRLLSSKTGQPAPDLLRHCCVVLVNGGGSGLETTVAAVVCDAVMLFLLMLFRWDSQSATAGSDAVSTAVKSLLPVAASIAPHPQVSRSALATRQLVAYRALGGVLLYLTHALSESTTQARSLVAMKSHLLALVEQGQAGPLAALHTAIQALPGSPAEEFAGGKQEETAKSKRKSTKRAKGKDEEDEAPGTRKSRRLVK